MGNNSLIKNGNIVVSEEMSKRITSLRYLLIVFVVFIHANLKPEDAINYYHYDFVQPHWIEDFKYFVCDVLGGAAVPLFFFFSAFLQFSKNDEYKVLLKKRSKSLFIPYVIWTCVTILLYFIAQSIPQVSHFFHNPDNIIREWSGIDWVKAFTYFNLTSKLKSPLVFQFWFLRELIILIILSPILKYLCEKFPALMFFIVTIVAVRGIPLFFIVSSSSLFDSVKICSQFL